MRVCKKRKPAESKRNSGFPAGACAPWLCLAVLASPACPDGRLSSPARIYTRAGRIDDLGYAASASSLLFMDGALVVSVSDSAWPHPERRGLRCAQLPLGLRGKCSRGVPPARPPARMQLPPLHSGSSSTGPGQPKWLASFVITASNRAACIALLATSDSVFILATFANPAADPRSSQPSFPLRQPRALQLLLLHCPLCRAPHHRPSCRSRRPSFEQRTPIHLPRIG